MIGRGYDSRCMYPVESRGLSHVELGEDILEILTVKYIDFSSTAARIPRLRHQ